MELEAVWLPDAVIKQEPDIDIKEELPEDEAGEMEYPPMEVKQEQLDSEGKHEQNELTSENDNYILTGTSGKLNTYISGNSSSPNPILQHEHVSGSDVSEIDEDFSEQKDINTAIHKDKQVAKFRSESKRPCVQVQKNDGSKEVDRHQICYVCNMSFTDMWSLNSHMTCHTDERTYTSLAQKEDLDIHISVHSGKQDHNGERPYSCDICYKSFKKRSDLKIHTRIHTGERPYSCEICNTSFISSSNLSSHMLKHTGQRSFKCEICNKSFTRRVQVRLHMRSHTGERPYSCEICNKSFARSGDLKAHIRSHTGERPYSCEVCNKSFICNGHLHTHMQTHTGERPYTCEICGGAFSRPANLIRHKRTHT